MKTKSLCLCVVCDGAALYSAQYDVLITPNQLDGNWLETRGSSEDDDVWLSRHKHQKQKSFAFAILLAESIVVVFFCFFFRGCFPREEEGKEMEGRSLTKMDV